MLDLLKYKVYNIYSISDSNFSIFSNSMKFLYICIEDSRMSKPQGKIAEHFSNGGVRTILDYYPFLLSCCVL